MNRRSIILYADRRSICGQGTPQVVLVGWNVENAQEMGGGGGGGGERLTDRYMVQSVSSKHFRQTDR